MHADEKYSILGHLRYIANLKRLRMVGYQSPGVLIPGDCFENIACGYVLESENPSGIKTKFYIYHMTFITYKDRARFCMTFIYSYTISRWPINAFHEFQLFTICTCLFSAYILHIVLTCVRGYNYLQLLNHAKANLIYSQ